MPKPIGTCGATKMKILAIISHNIENGQESYGYDIWKTMKEQFHIYLDDNDIGNVYHHLNDLSTLNYVNRENEETEGKCFYTLTDEGCALKVRYEQYIDILKNEKIDSKNQN
jgi:DNA-binding PadR family transcriptional regulator